MEEQGKVYQLNIINMYCQQQEGSATQSANWLNTQSYTKLTTLKYNSKSSSWQPYQHSVGSCSNRVSKILSLTLNVLTDCVMQAPLKRNLLFSQYRYEYILQYISEVNPHVVTFNQVTLNFYNMLIACQWVQKQYWVSQFDHLQTDGSFNVIMSRLQPVFARSISITNLARPVLTLYFDLTDQLSKKQSIVSVSCAHLTSLTKNVERRKKQFNELAHQLSNSKYHVSHVVQGDLNIHSEEQNVLFHEINWQDGWIVAQSQAKPIQENQILSKFPGFTFDGDKNSLIKEVYWGFEARRMRLDRIMYAGRLTCKQMKIILDEPIYVQGKEIQNYQRMGWLKGTVSLLGDVAGFNLFREKEKYLFPSDHFGLQATFIIDF